jgi:hypothetical protein
MKYIRRDITWRKKRRFVRGTKRTVLGGPAPKMLLFQMVPKSFLSVLIHSTRCKYDSLDCFFLIFDLNLPIGRVKCDVMGSGWNSCWFLLVS